MLKFIICILFSLLNFSNWKSSAQMNNNEVVQESMMYESEKIIEITNLQQYEGAHSQINSYLTISLNFHTIQNSVSKIEIIKEENISSIDLLTLDRNCIDTMDNKEYILNITLNQLKYDICVTNLIFKGKNNENYVIDEYVLTIYSYRINDEFFISFLSIDTAKSYANQFYGINEESKNYEILSSKIKMVENDITYQTISGKLCIEIESSDPLPARGILASLEIFTDNVKNTYKTYTNEEGIYSIEVPNLNNMNVNKMQLYFYAETKYTKIKFKDSEIYDPYNVSIDVTYVLNRTEKVVEDIKINSLSDTGQAFSIALGLNAAGDFCKEYGGKDIPQISCIYPYSDVTGYNGDSIFLEDADPNGYLHEYGHYAMGKFGITPSFGVGGPHREDEDLAINRGQKNGYALAWSEGIATYFSNVVQASYDYSWLCDNWKKKYEALQNCYVSSFENRESNEKTVTWTLLALTDPNFRYSNAIGIKRFFTLSSKIGHINRLGQFLDYIDKNNICNKDLLIESLSYYRLAPHRTYYQEEFIKKDISHYFSWNNGNYYSGRNKDTGEKIVNTNTDFVFRLYDMNNNLLYVSDVIPATKNTYSTSLTLDSETINEIFRFSSSVKCYWNVQGHDEFAGTAEDGNNTQYMFTSEDYVIYLDGFTVNGLLENIEQDNIDNLQIHSTLEYVYNSKEKKFQHKLHIYYKWIALPNAYLPDVVILSWCPNATYLESFNSVNYYDNDNVISTATEIKGQRIASDLTNQAYWYVDKSLKAKNTIYGETTLLFDLNNLSNVSFSIEYHYFLNTATAMQGVFINNDRYTTNTYAVKKLNISYNNIEGGL